MNMTSRMVLGAALAAGALTAIPAQADEGPFMMRLRGVYLDFAQKSDAFSITPLDGATINIPSDAVTLNKKWIPDIDLEWFFTPNISSELVLTYPQSQDVTVAVPGVGAVALGSFKHLPPTLTVKYNFMPGQDFRPYVGIGVNVTFISDVKLSVPAAASPTGATLPLDLDSTSVGFAGQLGFDYKFADHWFGNVDVKWVQLGSDVKIKDTGDVVTKVHLDPWLLGVGIGYRF